MKHDSLASIMNWSKNLYVFMLGALIVFSGCFGTGTTDGEGDDDAVGTTVINYYNNTTIADGEEWFSQGGNAAVHWNSDSMAMQAGTLDMSIWNFSDCSALGGTPDVNQFSMYQYPYCDIPLTSISTQSGQMLVIHEWAGFTLNTTCGSTTLTRDAATSLTEYGEWRAPGHAMDCVHDLFMDNIAPISDTSTTVRDPALWSIAYSYRTVTVV